MMKKFKVSEKCNACGRCTIMTNLLVEQADGKAIPSDNGYISDDFTNEAQEIIDACPVGALSIVESGSAKSTGKDGLKELEISLKVKLESIKIPKATREDIKFDANNYYIEYSDGTGENEYIYSSRGQAEKAGLEEFNKIAYSQYRPFILSVFVQYKNHKLKPFYTFEASEKNFYHNVNVRYEKILKDIATEANALTKGKILLPNRFEIFEVYPGNSNKYVRDRIKARIGEFEDRSTSSGIMAEFKSSSYSSLESYKSYIEIEEMETYEGEGLFGKSKYKMKYCYYCLCQAVDEYIKDLKNAMNYVDIDEAVLNDVNEAVDEYKKEVSKTIEEKLKDFSDAISRINM